MTNTHHGEDSPNTTDSTEPTSSPWQRDRSTGSGGGDLSTVAPSSEKATVASSSHHRDRPVGLPRERVGERRARQLVDLADAVRELTEPSTITEYVEVTSSEETVTRRGKRRKSTRPVRVRRAHRKRLPSLLDQLRYAEPPGTVDMGGATSQGAFESKPPAELASLSVLAEIVDGSRAWAKALGLPTKGSAESVLSSLVGAHMDDDDLALVTRQVLKWVRAAKHALRTDAMPITLGDPCPYCWRKNCLVITGDLASAHCSRCGRTWDQDTIGLLANMLQTNQQQATAAAGPDTVLTVPEQVRCWMVDCVRLGPHSDAHQDDRGRTWGDACAVTW